MIAVVMVKFSSYRVLWILLSTATAVNAAQSDDLFFENKIRPILVNRCGSCHSPEAKMGGIVLTRASAIQVISPGRVEDSKLIQACDTEAK